MNPIIIIILKIIVKEILIKIITIIMKIIQRMLVNIYKRNFINENFILKVIRKENINLSEIIKLNIDGDVNCLIKNR